jgi:HD-like signal output (HDOD) protein
MNDYIKEKLQKITFLPTFPHMVGELMSVIEDPMSSASDLAKHMDPSMVSEVLRVANSAYFGRNNFRRISTIERAVSIIGYTTLSCIVLQMPFLSMIRGRDEGFDRKEFIRHSICCGTLGKTISTAFTIGNPHEVYISGILHDIGSIIIYEHFKEEWHKIGVVMNEQQLPKVDAEKEVLSEDHASIGSSLLELWDLPVPIIEAVRLHHNPDMAEENETAWATWLGNKCAGQIDFAVDFLEFDTFFKKQRDIILDELPKKVFLNHQVDLFETAFLQLKDIDRFLDDAPGADE